jgi:hypothetical protein
MAGSLPSRLNRNLNVRALRHAVVALMVPLLLEACSAVGVPATSDPYVKLSQADYLWRESGRVMQARRRIDEAVAIFEERGDKHGLAEAYRAYGLIARIGGMNPDPIVVIKPGGVGHIAPSREELDLSDGFLTRALGLATEAQRFDLVTNLNFLLGNNQVLRGEPLKSCPFYDLSLAASHETEKQQPGITVKLPPGGRSMGEVLARAKREAGCPSS